MDTQLQFVDSVLSGGPTGKRQLKVPSVLDLLSAIKTCFLQASIPFDWHPTCYRYVRGEAVWRRQ